MMRKEEWTADIIAERQEELINLLVKEWQLEITTPKNSENDMLFYLRSKDSSANGYPIKESFKVLKGSVCSGTETDSIRESYKELRESLTTNGVLVYKNGRLVFEEDYTFSSPSTAASIILGRSSNGQTAWKNYDDRTLKEVLD